MPYHWRKDSADDRWHCCDSSEETTCCGVIEAVWVDDDHPAILAKGAGGKVCKTCFDAWLNLSE